ncbi:MAG: haloalkane dehalogenase [Chloroflexi bacterium]|nr:haloalkane dehalogenase [Chloroflexota bacterium]
MSDEGPRQRITVLDAEMAYVDEGSGPPLVFLHGNPTSSYLWRQIIPPLTEQARCLAPDLVGMGASGANPRGRYRFVDHARYLDAWLDSLALTENVTFVGHDWGSALAFHRACRYPEQIRALIYMEALVCPLTWADWPEAARPIFQAMRSPAGEEIILQKNVFVERILPASIQRELTAVEMAVYRAPYREAGEARRPTLTWPREIPIDGEPADVHAIVEAYAAFLARSAIPKLFINAEPGMILTGRPREFARSFPNQHEVTVSGLHFIQEDSPREIAAAIAEFWLGLG